jgi:hypothetical protein
MINSFPQKKVLHYERQMKLRESLLLDAFEIRRPLRTSQSLTLEIGVVV